MNHYTALDQHHPQPAALAPSDTARGNPTVSNRGPFPPTGGSPSPFRRPARP